MKEISRKTIILYCLPLFAVGLFTTMLNNYLIYFYQPTVSSGLPTLITQGYVFAGLLTVIGLIKAIGHVIDAVSDPLVASLSDKCSHGGGRRIPFMRYFAFPFALSALLIFCSPFSKPVMNDIWLAVTIWIYYIFYTLYMIPHSALLPEMVKNEGQLLDSYTWHSLFFVVGSMLGYATPAIVSLIKKAGAVPVAAWRMTFLFFTVAGALLLFLPACIIREKDYVKSIRPTEPLIKSLKHAFSNRHFRIVTLGQLLEGTGMSFFQACIMYYITELMGIPEEQSILIMASSIVGSLVLYPVVNQWSKRSGKKIPMIAGCLVFAAAEFIICFVDVFPAEYALVTAVGFALFVSLPFAVLNILPGSMMADVIRYDTALTGINQEGTFSAAKSFVTKMGTSIATMIVPSLIVAGAVTGQSIGKKGLLLTAVVGGIFTLAAVAVYIVYNEKEVLSVIRNTDWEGFLVTAGQMQERKLSSAGSRHAEEKLIWYARRLQGMIQCRTVSVKDSYDDAEFSKLRDTMKELFPLVHEKSRRMIFSDDCWVYEFTGRDRSRNIMLMSHHDVVPAKGQWEHDPFAGEIAEGRLWGRGTVDTKTPLFAEFSAMEELLEQGCVPPCNVFLASSHNEEQGGDGIPEALNYFKEQGITFEVVLDEGGAIIDPPLGGMKCDKCAMVAVHEVGRYKLNCTAISGNAHGGLTAAIQSNSTERMAGFIHEVTEHDLFIRRLNPQVSAMFEHLAPYCHFPMKMLLGNLWLFGGLLRKVIPGLNPQAKSMLGTTCSFKKVEGDEQKCTASLSFRSVDEEDMAKDLDAIRKAAEKYGVEIAVDDSSEYHASADMTRPAFDYTMECIARVFPWYPAVPFILPAGTDARTLTEICPCVLRFAPICLSAGQLGSVHAENENIDLTAIAGAVEFYKDFLQNYR